jgi:ATP/maltotriose-dependent transcriptional regulator MalT
MVTKHVRALVGRARELAELDEALDQVAGGQPWFLQIVGEAGIGKSRLLVELADRAEARGCLVLDGRAAEFEQDIPFGLIVAALNDYLGSLDAVQLRGLDQDALRELASIFPSFPRPNGSTARTGDGAERYRLHYSIRAVLEELARRQPLVLALDDIHWADAASAEVITHLLRRFRGPLLTAVAYRHAPARLLATLEGAARVDLSSRIDLAPLTPDEATELIGPNVDDATRATLYRESGGNPFYIEQLARSSHASQDRIPGGSVRAAEPIPRAVIAAIHEQLMGVSEAARRVLEAAAVAGESFEPELIAAIAEVNEPEALEAVDELLDAELLQATEAPRRFRFRHPIVRRAVYDRTARGWQIGAHARAALSLAYARVPASAIAHHVEGSAAVGDEQAIALLTEAGREVAPRAPETAGRWLLAATRLLPQHGGDDDRRVSLLFEAASALTFAGAYDEALAALDEIGALLSPTCVRERAELVAKISFATRMSGRPLETRILVTRALEHLPPEASSALALKLDLAIDHYWRGEFAAMHEVAEPVLAEARDRGETLFVALAAALCSIASGSMNGPGHALAELDEARKALDSLSDEQMAERIDVAGYVAQAASALERIDEALECIYRGKRLAEMTGQTPYIPGMLVQETNALVMKGRIGEAKAVAETTTDAAVLTGNDQFAIWALWADAMVCSCAGDTTRALTSAREAVARSEHVPATFFSSLSHLHLAAALHAGGDLAGARAELARFEEGPAQQLLDLRGGHGWELLVLTQLAVGELDAAVDSAARAEARARATSLPHRTVTALSASAAVSLARGDPAGAIERAREAIALASTAGNPLLGARARALVGTALGRRGETQEGIVELEQAERTLLDCGALREASAAARELRRLGHRGRRRVRAASRGTGPDALSPRETEIATLVAAGKRNRDVAAALFLSEKTVESHLARIYDKVGVHSRAALAAIIAREASQKGVPSSTEPGGRGRGEP